MGVPSLRRSLSLSLVVHAILLTVWLVLFAQQATKTPSKQLVWIEVDPLANLKAKRRKRDEANDKKVVQTDPGRAVERAPEDAMLGARNQVVDRQTVSKNKMTVMGSKPKTAASPKSKEKAKEKSNESAKLSELGKFGIPILPNPAMNRPAQDQPQWADMGNSPQDYVQGMKESDRTALNTREFVYFGYYQRIRERLDRAWIPILKRKLIAYHLRGRQLASDMDHTTKVKVVMNNKGDIVRVLVMAESGTRDLDDAAVMAFNQAGPFPNPPKGMMNAAGEIEIPWEFVIKG